MDENKKIEFTSAFKTLYTQYITQATVPGIMNRNIFYSTEPIIDEIINKEYTRNREDVYAVFCSLYNSDKKIYNEIVFYCNKYVLFDRFRIFSKSGIEYEYIPNIILITDQIKHLNNKHNLIKVCYFNDQYEVGKGVDNSNKYGLEQMQKCIIHNVKVYPKYVWLDIFENV